ncbi:hypothetical protein GCM10010236_79420 [Streptomyces eurythermus]|nr:hypothetical protein GCM10010236_79420 [Streptomyces eurythermus]
MAGRRGLLHVAQGSAFLLNGVGWTVEVMEPQHGRLTLVHADGHRESRSIRWLVHQPDARVLSEAVGRFPACGAAVDAGRPWR